MTSNREDSNVIEIATLGSVWLLIIFVAAKDWCEGKNTELLHRKLNYLIEELELASSEAQEVAQRFRRADRLAETTTYQDD